MYPSFDSLIIILLTTVVIYTIYLIYLKLTNAETIINILNKNLSSEENIKEITKIKNKHMMVFMIGLLIGFVIILIKDNNIIEKVSSHIDSVKYINDVEDICVL